MRRYAKPKDSQPPGTNGLSSEMLLVPLPAAGWLLHDPAPGWRAGMGDW